MSNKYTEEINKDKKTILSIYNSLLAFNVYSREIVHQDINSLIDNCIINAVYKINKIINEYGYFIDIFKHTDNNYMVWCENKINESFFKYMRKFYSDFNIELGIFQFLDNLMYYIDNFGLILKYYNNIQLNNKYFVCYSLYKKIRSKRSKNIYFFNEYQKLAQVYKGNINNLYMYLNKSKILYMLELLNNYHLKKNSNYDITFEIISNDIMIY